MVARDGARLTYPTEQPVINIKTAKWAPAEKAINDLLSALRSGKLIAHGMFDGERRPRLLETTVWSTCEIIVKAMMFAGRVHIPTSGKSIVIARMMGRPRTRLLSVTVPAARVRTLWPVTKRTLVSVARCQNYLAAEMKRSLDRAPKHKADFFADCRARFPGLSERGFERAWANAIRLTGAVGWGKAGRRPKSSQ